MVDSGMGSGGAGESIAAGEPFFWGVASSGYQCEGGYNGPGEPENNWVHAEREGNVMVSGRATDFWNRYPEDLDVCRRLGLNAFRLSIEWARVQPGSLRDEGGPEPAFDAAAISGYANLVAACRVRGLEPVVTLQHFTHPAWLGLDAWLDDATPARFEGFVRYVMGCVNEELTERHGQQPVKWMVTLNEPNMLVLNTYLNRHFPGKGGTGMAVGVRAYNRLLAAHVRAYNALHDLYESRGWPPPSVTMNTFCSDVYWSENMLLDLLESRHRGVQARELGDFFVDSSRQLRKALLDAKLPFPSDPFVWAGRIVHWVTDRLAPRHANGQTFQFLLAEIERSPRSSFLDYLGLDYYDPFIGHILRAPSFEDLEFPSRSPTGYLMNGLSRKWWDWNVLAEGLHFFVSYYSRRYGGRGVLIAENGMAQRCKQDGSFCSPRRDRLTRSQFLEAHVGQVMKLRREGVPLLGYLHWSITDNYEWGSYTPRFGLVHIDYTRNAKRCLEDPLGDCPTKTYARLVAAARAEFSREDS
ncbi:MAG: family 1 glycosylhydrolase [Terrimicrobiaceae bacterium]